MDFSGQIFIQNCYHHHEAHTLAVDEAPGNSILAISECSHLHTVDNIWKTYWTDFSEYKHDLWPGDWNEDYWNPAVGILLAKNDEGCVFGPLGLRLDTTSNVTHYAANWTKVPDDYDFEILMKVKLDEADQNLGGCVLRLSGGAAEWGILTFLNETADFFRLYRNANGSGADIVAQVSYTIAAQEWHWVRLQAWGDEIKAKAWKYGEAEPSAWLHEATYAGVPGPGAVGINTYDGDFVVDYYSVGVGGITAPFLGPRLNVHHGIHLNVSDNVVCDPAWLIDLDAYHAISDPMFYDDCTSLTVGPYGMSEWNIVDAGADLTVVSEKFHFDGADTVYLYGQRPLVGDFDVWFMMDFTTLGHNHYMRLYLTTIRDVIEPASPAEWTDMGYYTYSAGRHGMIRDGSTTATSSFALVPVEDWEHPVIYGVRMQRVGSVIKGWYWNPSIKEWDYRGSPAGFTYAENFTGPCYMTFYKYGAASIADIDFFFQDSLRLFVGDLFVNNCYHDIYTDNVEAEAYHFTYFDVATRGSWSEGNASAYGYMGFRDDRDDSTFSEFTMYCMQFRTGYCVWNDVAAARDSETLAKWKSEGAATGKTFHILTRWLGYAALFNGQTNKLRITKDYYYGTGGVDLMTPQTPPFTFAGETYYWMRFRNWGKQLKAKVWEDGQPEPAAWLMEVEDGTHFGDGKAAKIGWGNADTATYADVDFFSHAIGEGFVPKLAVDPAGPTVQGNVDFIDHVSTTILLNSVYIQDGIHEVVSPLPNLIVGVVPNNPYHDLVDDGPLPAQSVYPDDAYHVNFPHSAQCNDDFTGSDGDPPNSNLWTEADDYDILDIYSNKLRIDDSVVQDSPASITSKFVLPGDFDVQIDWDVVAMGEPSLGSHVICMLQINWGGDFARIWKHEANLTEGMNYQSTADASTYIAELIDTGQFRMIRNGTDLTCWYKVNGGWEWNGDPDGYTFTDTVSGDCTVIIYGYHKAGALLTADWDNFRVNYGATFRLTQTIQVADCYHEHLVENVKFFLLVNQDCYHDHVADYIELPALFFTDFSEYTTDQQPSDWTKRFDLGFTALVKEDAELLGGKYLDMNWSVSDEHLLSWDKADTCKNVEILCRVVAKTPGNPIFRVSLRSSGGDATENAYQVHIDDLGNDYRMGRYISGSWTYLGVQQNHVFAVDTWFWVRMRVNENNLYIKIWDDGDAEPAAWSDTTTDGLITDGGWAGVFIFGERVFVDAVWIGTGGLSAPSILVVNDCYNETIDNDSQPLKLPLTVADAYHDLVDDGPLPAQSVYPDNAYHLVADNCPYEDNFDGSDGDPPNNFLWRKTIAGPGWGTLKPWTILSNVLQFSASGAGDESARSFTRHFPSGDFRIELEFNLPNISDPPSSYQYGAVIALNTPASGKWCQNARARGTIQHYYTRNSSDNGFAATYEPETSGTLRVERIGNTVTFWYYDPPQFEWAGSANGYTYSDSFSGECQIAIACKKVANSTVSYQMTRFRFVYGGGLRLEQTNTLAVANSYHDVVTPWWWIDAHHDLVDPGPITIVEVGAIDLVMTDGGAFHLNVVDNIVIDPAWVYPTDTFHLHVPDNIYIGTVYPEDCYHDLVDWAQGIWWLQDAYHDLVDSGPLPATQVYPNDCFHLDVVTPTDLTLVEVNILANLNAYHDLVTLDQVWFVQFAYHDHVAEAIEVMSIFGPFHLHVVAPTNLTLVQTGETVNLTMTGGGAFHLNVPDNVVIDPAWVYPQTSFHLNVVTPTDLPATQIYPADTYHDLVDDGPLPASQVYPEDCYHLNVVTPTDLTLLEIEVLTMSDAGMNYHVLIDSGPLPATQVYPNDCFHLDVVTPTDLTITTQFTLVMTDGGAYHDLVANGGVDIDLAQHFLSMNDSYHDLADDGPLPATQVYPNDCFHLNVVTPSDLTLVEGVILTVAAMNYHDFVTLDEVWFVQFAYHDLVTANIDLAQHFLSVADNFHLNVVDPTDLTLVETGDVTLTFTDAGVNYHDLEDPGPLDVVEVYDLVMTDGGAYHDLVDDGPLTVLTFYVTDFGEYTTGQQPSDWTERWHTLDFISKVRAGGMYGGKYLEIVADPAGTEDRYRLTWDKIPNTETDGESLILYRAVYSVWCLYSGLRITDGENDYHARMNYYTDMEGIQIGRTRNGTLSNVTTRLDKMLYYDLWYFVRFRVDGNALKAKSWRMDVEEPVGWERSGIDNEHADGSVGFGFGEQDEFNDELHVEWFGYTSGAGTVPAPAVVYGANHDLTDDAPILIDYPYAVPNSCYHDHVVPNLAITQDHTLAMSDAGMNYHLNVITPTDLAFPLPTQSVYHDLVDPGPLTTVQIHILHIWDAYNHHVAGAIPVGATGDPLELTQLHFLDPEDCAHDLVDPGITLDEWELLRMDDGIHENVPSSIDLTQWQILGMDSCYHIHAPPNVDLTQEHYLTAQNAFQLHSVPNLTLTQDHTLIVQGAVNLHVPESPWIGVHLAGLDSDHICTSSTFVLTQEHNLALAGDYLDHLADNVPMIVPITVQDNEHQVTSDLILLHQSHFLAVVGAAHTHVVTDSIVLFQLHELEVAGTGQNVSYNYFALTSDHMDFGYLPATLGGATLTIIKWVN